MIEQFMVYQDDCAAVCILFNVVGELHGACCKEQDRKLALISQRWRSNLCLQTPCAEQ